MRRRDGRVVTRAGAQACGRKPETQRSAGLFHRRGGLAQNHCHGLPKKRHAADRASKGTGLAVRAIPYCSAAREPPGGRPCSRQRGSPGRHRLWK